VRLDSGLPRNWVCVEFGDLIEESQNGCSARHGTGIPTVVLRLADLTIEGVVATEGLREIPLSDADRKKYALRHGDLLAFRVNGSQQITGQVVCYPGPDGFAYCDHFIRFRLRDGMLLPGFAAYAFRAWPVRDQVASGMVSTAGQNTVSQKTYGSVQLFLPPLNEQQRIVDVIESYFTRLDDTVATLERVERNLKRYRASVLKSAVEGRLVPTEAALARQEGRDYEPASVLLERTLFERRRRWVQSGKKGSYEEPMPSDTTNLPDLPGGWCWANLSQLKDFSLYGPRFSSDAYTDEGRLVLRTSDISEDGKVNLQTAPRISLSDTEFRKYQARTGDLLITRTGSLGTLAVFNDNVDAIPGAYLIQYRLHGPSVLPWYCFHAFKSPAGQAFLHGKGAGVGRPNLNAPSIESYPIALPPVVEQERIHAELQRLFSVADAAERQVSESLARCKRLRQSILKWAFEGKLADQDPNDEPASVLLERIKAERATAKPTKPTRTPPGTGKKKRV
jgi:type I restriction enzyme, S subunit